MKNITLFFIALFCFPILAIGQPTGSSDRKLEIERLAEDICSITEFQCIADSLQMTIDELCNFPIIFPIKKLERISSGFGWRMHPISKVRQFHTGIDIPKAKGTPVYATGNGVVIRKGYCSGYGNFVEIQHAGDFRTLYAHLSQTMVNVGNSVNIAQQIGCVGNTGVSTGSHLHYEVRKRKRYLNPKEWCYCLYNSFYFNI